MTKASETPTYNQKPYKVRKVIILAYGK